MLVGALFSILLLVWVALFVWLFWGLHCNNVTFDQRDRMLKAIFRRPDWLRLVEQYNEVSYDAHCRAVERFRDPWALYSEELNTIWQGAH